ncbi:metallophosphoesterase [Pendulispora rubella]|uniref:Metallophosphoesterase n=1 Tax=Pendulispora rubella TaxID=2741070 RepID=A0ABZ2KYA2_9BACT
MSDALLLHLSDLHFCKTEERDPAPELRKLLCKAVGTVVEEAGPDVRVGLVVTGDLIDSSDTPAERIADVFRSFVHDLREVIGSAPIVLLPGNHDRRIGGVFAPWSTRAMQDLEAAVSGDGCTYVHAPNADEPLAHSVHELSSVLGVNVVAYDSTHAIEGKISAGGLFRTTDLLAVPGIVGCDKPVVLLLHHHLVPTPVTDVGVMDTSHTTWFERNFVQRFLPWLVSFADREELFMTALGAGTTLTLLGSLGSATVVLHGHKHYPTARLLRATQAGDGDVLIASAGSSGTLEQYRALGPRERTFLWPSFNAVTFRGDDISIETVFFSPKGTRPNVRQVLARATRKGASWEGSRVEGPSISEVRVASDEAEFLLRPGGVGLWDVSCLRRLGTPPGSVRSYQEPLDALPRAEISGERVSVEPNGRVTLRVDPGETSYRATSALVRTVGEARRRNAGDAFSPFQCVSLKVRRGAGLARLVLRGLPRAAEICFGTLTDLNTGQERPIALEPADDGVSLVVPFCPARRLLRIHWPLETA